MFAARHKLEALVQQYGSREGAVREILSSIRGKTPPSGTFEVITTVGGQIIVVRGAVIDGVAKLGTAFSP